MGYVVGLDYKKYLVINKKFFRSWNANLEQIAFKNKKINNIDFKM